MSIFCVLFICVIFTIACRFFRMEEQIRREPRQERTEVAVIPVHATASTNRHNDQVPVRYENLATNVGAANYNACSYFQQPSAPVTEAVGGVDTGDISHEPFARYEFVMDDQGRFSRVQPSRNTFKGNRPMF